MQPKIYRRLESADQFAAACKVDHPDLDFVPTPTEDFRWAVGVFRHGNPTRIALAAAKAGFRLTRRPKPEYDNDR